MGRHKTEYIRLDLLHRNRMNQYGSFSHFSFFPISEQEFADNDKIKTAKTINTQGYVPLRYIVHTYSLFKVLKSTLKIQNNLAIKTEKLYIQLNEQAYFLPINKKPCIFKAFGQNRVSQVHIFFTKKSKIVYLQGFWPKSVYLKCIILLPKNQKLCIFKAFGQNPCISSVLGTN